ncbi:hypothetical protein BJ546DRAFT_70684 [Cryomyces antarcticus]
MNIQSTVSTDMDGSLMPATYNPGTARFHIPLPNVRRTYRSLPSDGIPNRQRSLEICPGSKALSTCTVTWHNIISPLDSQALLPAVFPSLSYDSSIQHHVLSGQLLQIFQWLQRRRQWMSPTILVPQIRALQQRRQRLGRRCSRLLFGVVLVCHVPTVVQVVLVSLDPCLRCLAWCEGEPLVAVGADLGFVFPDVVGVGFFVVVFFTIFVVGVLSFFVVALSFFAVFFNSVIFISLRLVAALIVTLDHPLVILSSLHSICALADAIIATSCCISHFGSLARPPVVCAVAFPRRILDAVVAEESSRFPNAYKIVTPRQPQSSVIQQGPPERQRLLLSRPPALQPRNTSPAKATQPAILQ